MNRTNIASYDGSGNKPYNISFSFDDGMFQCGCRAWTCPKGIPKGERKDCKHIDALVAKIRKAVSDYSLTLLDDPLALNVLGSLPTATWGWDDAKLRRVVTL